MNSSLKSSLTREYYFDNLRCFLIICVVVGHLLEVFPAFRGSALLYRIIYSFHMPVFIFLFGYFSFFRPSRIVFSLVLPYLLFQPLYLFFSQRFLGVAQSYQYTTPYWILWYLLACIFYQLLLPFLHAEHPRKQMTILTFSVAAALLAGYDNSIGYYLSLSRFFVFMPWFLFGYYCKKNERLFGSICGQKAFFFVLISFIIISLSVFYLRRSAFPSSALYGSYSYDDLGYSMLDRLVFMLISLAWLIFLLNVFRLFFNRKLPVISSIGQSTLPVFLLHGFVIKPLPAYMQYIRSPLLSIFLISLLILAAFGNPLIGWLFKFLFSDQWIKKPKALLN